MNIAELSQRDPKELRQLCAQYGIKAHHKLGADKLVKLIVEHVSSKPQGDPMKHAAEKPKAPTHVHSEEETRELLKAYLAKPGFTAEFPGDDTVILRYKGVEESIHLSTGPRTLTMKAGSVARGAYRMITVKNSDGNDVMMAGV